MKRSISDRDAAKSANSELLMVPIDFGYVAPEYENLTLSIIQKDNNQNDDLYTATDSPYEFEMLNGTGFRSGSLGAALAERFGDDAARKFCRDHSYDPAALTPAAIKSAFPEFPELPQAEQAAVFAQGRKNQWSQRVNKRADVINYIESVYGRWIVKRDTTDWTDKGLTRALIAKADPELDKYLRNWLHNLGGKFPDNWWLPSLQELAAAREERLLAMGLDPRSKDIAQQGSLARYHLT